MDELSPAGIDNHYAVFHLTDGVVVNQVSGLLRERAVQGDDPSCGTVRPAWYIPPGARGRNCSRDTGRRRGYSCRNRAGWRLTFGYFACADDTRRFHIESQRPCREKIAVRVRQVARGIFRLRESMRATVYSRHRVRGVGGDAHHGNAVSANAFRSALLSGTAQGKEFHTRLPPVAG